MRASDGQQATGSSDTVGTSHSFFKSFLAVTWMPTSRYEKSWSSCSTMVFPGDSGNSFSHDTHKFIWSSSLPILSFFVWRSWRSTNLEGNHCFSSTSIDTLRERISFFLNVLFSVLMRLKDADCWHSHASSNHYEDIQRANLQSWMVMRNLPEFTCDNKHQAREVINQRDAHSMCRRQRSLLYSDEVEGVVFNIEECIDLVVLLLVWSKWTTSTTASKKNAVVICSLLSVSFSRSHREQHETCFSFNVLKTKCTEAWPTSVMTIDWLNVSRERILSLFLSRYREIRCHRHSFLSCVSFVTEDGFSPCRSGTENIARAIHRCSTVDLLRDVRWDRPCSRYSSLATRAVWCRYHRARRFVGHRWLRRISRLRARRCE